MKRKEVFAAVDEAGLMDRCVHNTDGWVILDDGGHHHQYVDRRSCKVLSTDICRVALDTVV